MAKFKYIPSLSLHSQNSCAAIRCDLVDSYFVRFNTNPDYYYVVARTSSGAEVPVSEQFDTQAEACAFLEEEVEDLC